MSLLRAQTFLLTVLSSVFMSACSLNATKFLGDWQQSYSDAYVQTTSEVDWKCVEVHVEKANGNDTVLGVSKTAYLHRIPSLTPFFRTEKTTVNTTLRVKEDDTLEVSDGSFLPHSLEVRILEDDMVVLTGIELPTLYIWTKQSTDTANISRVLEDLERWNYVTPEKFPLPSYWETCQ